MESSPITKAERAALALIVNSGRAFVEVEMLSTSADDGRVSASGRRGADGAFRGHFGLGGDEPLDAQTAGQLRSRGLVDVWAVGIVKVVNRDKRTKSLRPATLATLTPYAAATLGVKLVGTDGVLRWAAAGGPEPAEVIDDPGTPYPEPMPELDRFPSPASRGRSGTARTRGKSGAR